MVPWVLVLVSPDRAYAATLGGLPLPLRLALDAQAAGAAAIVVPEGSGLEPCLTDSRLTLPIVQQAPADLARVEVHYNLLVHRRLFHELRERLHGPLPHTLDLRKAAPDAKAAHSPAPPGDSSDGKGASNPIAIRVRATPEFVPNTAYTFAPIEVHDAASYRTAEEQLFRSLRKAEDGWTARFLNRSISLFLSKRLVRTRLRPNQVSVGILAVGLCGAALAAQGQYWSTVLGALLFQLQSVLDGCDGEMSRVSHRGSYLGEWLDTIGDDLTNYSFFAGAAWGLLHQTGSTLYLIAGVLIVVCGVTASGIEYRYLAKIGSGDLLKYPLSASNADGSGLLGAIGPLFKRDTFVFLTLIAAVLNLLGPMLLVFSLAAVGILFSVFAAELRMARERRQSQHQPQALSPSPPAEPS